MARHRSFDEGAVLGAAMQVFRQAGYAATSVRDLEEATGLRASSLYNAYGDKAGLFRRALDHYATGFVRQRYADHAGPQARLEDLERLYLSLFEPPLSDGFGCLVTNTAVELGPREPGAEGVRATLEDLDERLVAVLRRETGSAEGAAALALTYHGLLVLSRAGLLEERHRGAVRSEFTRLRRCRATFREDTP